MQNPTAGLLVSWLWDGLDGAVVGWGWGFLPYGLQVMVFYSLVRLSVDVWPEIDDFWLWPCETAMLAGAMYLFSTKP